MSRNTKARYMVIRSNGSTHTGFPIRNRGTVPAGYQLMGYAYNTYELAAILFPKG